jgi:DNA polymerase-3 subunit gamma/tau
MSYLALYRKWRPLVFEDVVEQEHVVKTLKNSVVSDHIAHAYLFCGTRGTGKTTMAKIFSRAINCLNPKMAIHVISVTYARVYCPAVLWMLLK